MSGLSAHREARLREVLVRHPALVRASTDTGVELGDGGLAARIVEHLAREHGVTAEVKGAWLELPCVDADDVERAGAALDRTLAVIAAAACAVEQVVAAVRVRGLTDACVGVVGADELFAAIACELAPRVPRVLLVDAPGFEAELDEVARRARAGDALVVGTADAAELRECDIVVARGGARVARWAGHVRRDALLLLVDDPERR